MCVLGMSKEFQDAGIAVNALWPQTAIITAAMEMLGGKDVANMCRKPEIMSDAAYVILTRDKSFTGNFVIDGVDENAFSMVPGSSKAKGEKSATSGAGAGGV